MRVVSQRLDHIGARVHEIEMELTHDLRMLEHDLGHERAGLQIAAPLEFEQVAFGANDRTGVETLQERGSWFCSGVHLRTSRCLWAEWSTISFPRRDRQSRCDAICRPRDIRANIRSAAVRFPGVGQLRRRYAFDSENRGSRKCIG